MPITDEQFREAMDAANALNAAAQEATTKATAAEAKAYALFLVQTFERNPGLDSLDFEVSYEYDDEGGYFACMQVSTSVDPDVKGQTLNEYDEIEEEDDLRALVSIEAARMVFGHEWDASISRSEIESRIAELEVVDAVRSAG